MDIKTGNGGKLASNETFTYGFGPPYSNSPSKHG